MIGEASVKVLAINGSARKGGNTAILLRTVLKELEAEGVQTELVEMAGGKIHGCRSCKTCSPGKNRRCSQTADMGNVYLEKMEKADAIILGSPTYVTDVSTEMKALIDRATQVSWANGGMWRRKVGAGVVAVRRGGAIHAFETLNNFFLINEMIVPGSTYWNIGIGLQPGEVESDEEGMRTMKNLGRNMAWLLKKIHA
jgi:multimeric flavodoxin WrbA